MNEEKNSENEIVISGISGKQAKNLNFYLYLILHSFQSFAFFQLFSVELSFFVNILWSINNQAELTEIFHPFNAFNLFSREIK